MKTAADLEARIKGRAASDEAFRTRLLSDPRGAIEEACGLKLPEQFRIHVHAETETERHFVLPAPDVRLSEDELSEVAGGYGITTGW